MPEFKIGPKDPNLPNILLNLEKRISKLEAKIQKITHVPLQESGAAIGQFPIEIQKKLTHLTEQLSQAQTEKAALIASQHIGSGSLSKEESSEEMALSNLVTATEQFMLTAKSGDGQSEREALEAALETARSISDKSSKSGDSREIVLSLKEAIENAELAIWEAEAEQDQVEDAVDDQVIRFIIQDLMEGNVDKLKEFANSLPPPTKSEIANLITELTSILKKQKEPIPETWKFVSGIIQWYENLVNNVHEDIPHDQIFRTAIYIVEKIINNEQLINKFLETHEDLPLRLVVDRNKNITVLPYDIRNIAQELQKGATAALKHELYKDPPYDQKVLDYLKYELARLAKSQSHPLPGAWKFLDKIYAEISKEPDRKGKDLETLQDTVNFIEDAQGQFQTPYDLFLLLKIRTIARRLDEGNVTALRGFLQSAHSLSEKEFVHAISHLKQLLANKEKPLPEAWQFLEAILRNYDALSKIKSSASEYDKLSKAIPDCIQYIITPITKGLDKDSLTDLLNLLHSTPPLSPEEIQSLMLTFERSLEGAAKQSTAWLVLKNTIKAYQVHAKPMTSLELMKAISGARVQIALNILEKDLGKASERNLVDKLRSAIQFNPVLNNEEIEIFLSRIKETLLEQKPLSAAAKLLQTILQRYQQISTVTIEKGKGISHYDQLLIAAFIEYDIKILGKKTEAIFHEHTHGVPRTIHLDKTGNLTIWARHKVSIVRGEGSYKKVISAVKIPFANMNAPAERVVIAHMKRYDEDQTIIRREAEILKKLQGIPHVIQLHSVINIDDSDRTNIALTLFEYGSNLKELYKKSKPNFTQQQSFAAQIISAVHDMHKRNIFHWDLKLENILSRGEDVFLMDFGMAFEPGQTKPLSPSYGSPLYSAPELVYRNQYAFDPQEPEACKAVEVMAIGLMLYKLHFEKDFPYPTTTFAQHYPAQIEAQIEEPLRILLKKEPKKPEDHYKIMIYKMLKSNPKERISLEGALEALRTISKPSNLL